MKQYMSRKLLSPGMYKQSLIWYLNEKLRSYKSSHFWREISKLIKNCNLWVENALKYYNYKHKVIHKVCKTLGRLRKYGLVTERLWFQRSRLQYKLEYMCLAIPSIIVSDFHANRSRFIVNMWFKFFSLPLQVFRPYFVVFLALGMFYFCEIPCKPLQNKNFPPSCFFHFCQPWNITNSPWLGSQSKLRICNSPWPSVY